MHNMISGVMRKGFVRHLFNFNFDFCSFVCSFLLHSAFLLLSRCLPAAFFGFRLSREARPRHLLEFNRRLRRGTSFLLMCAHASAHYLFILSDTF